MSEKFVLYSVYVHAATLYWSYGTELFRVYCAPEKKCKHKPRGNIRTFWYTGKIQCSTFTQRHQTIICDCAIVYICGSSVLNGTKKNIREKHSTVMEMNTHTRALILACGCLTYLHLGAIFFFFLLLYSSSNVDAEYFSSSSGKIFNKEFFLFHYFFPFTHCNFWLYIWEGKI